MVLLTVKSATHIRSDHGRAYKIVLVTSICTKSYIVQELKFKNTLKI